ncbi:N-formylglutamate amidohydrolase [Aliiroseovarius lamellibrachiae]|uniref:N-formylglutamate amidohydrolase n=1 Tax=Aliiroseovarius lamellibrachiae TaxID=1924933 RepID=UPI001BE09DB0|nr:N-formylglutamate amidohydrolase [Aliiroseovarius lamellibrachiae]MBT2132209.1 N-formylglutamate amidohydrolase [Aliiroseovarius lamellibrachiae]
MRNSPYTLRNPKERSSSVVFASPHSGRAYGWDFLQNSILDERLIRSSEDAYVDKLFQAAPDCGAPLLAANTPRAFVDFNRGTEELDPALVRGVRRPALNARISAGLGVIPRVVAGGRAIYHGKMSMSEAQTRLNDTWFPYHNQLQTLLDQSHRAFGEAILIDCHSMPHDALRNVMLPQGRPEIVLGDRHGASASSGIVGGIENAFQRAGFIVARNIPFAGAFVTQHYGRPSRQQHVIQVEIDRSLYMNEAQIRPNGQFHNIQARLAEAIQEICDIGRTCEKLAAE